jgi:hypothetical protein
LSWWAAFSRQALLRQAQDEGAARLRAGQQRGTPAEMANAGSEAGKIEQKIVFPVINAYLRGNGILIFRLRHKE